LCGIIFEPLKNVSFIKAYLFLNVAIANGVIVVFGAAADDGVAKLNGLVNFVLAEHSVSFDFP